MFEDDPTTDNIVTLPFVAARRAASAPALGRFGRLLGGSTLMQELYRRIARVAPTFATICAQRPIFLSGWSPSAPTD